MPDTEEILLILEHPYPDARRLFLVMVNTAFRIDEIRRCDVQDFDQEKHELRVVGKGGKARMVPLNSVALEDITEEIDGRRATKPGESLFVNREGHRYKSLRTPLKTACRKASVPHIGHYSLQQAYATAFCQEHPTEMDVINLSKILGHANPEITKKFHVHPEDDSVRRAAESFEIRPGKKLYTLKKKGGKTA